MSSRRNKRAMTDRPSMEFVVEMASSAAATKRMNAFPASSTTSQLAPVQQVHNSDTWIGVFLQLLHQLRTRRLFVAASLLFGTADMLLNVVNLVQMSSDDLNYVLVIGPPPQDLWICMVFFTVVGTLLYIPETINTVSAMRSEDGDTLVPFHTELTVTLLVEHIPLSVIDYLIARSRRQYTTDVGSYCAGVRLIFIAIRLIWYAHIEGRKIRKNDKYELHQFFILVNYVLFTNYISSSSSSTTCCLQTTSVLHPRQLRATYNLHQFFILVNYVLFSVAVAFPINNWRHEPDGILKDYHLETVSVYMLQRDKPPEGNFKIDITDDLKEQGWTSGNTTLVHSAWTIYKADQVDGHPVIAYYDCHHRGQERPRECTRHGARYLRFSFIFRPDKRLSPWGVISYNYAEICLDPSANNHSSDHGNIAQSPFYPACYEAKSPLMDGWRLFFFRTERQVEDGRMRYRVLQSFFKVQTSTMPKYDSKIVVCGKNIRSLCNDMKKKPTRRPG